MDESQDILRRALNLSLAIYRVSQNFPEGEVLGAQMKELGNEIAGSLAEKDYSSVLKRIERLQIYFRIARQQKWVRAINWSILEFEYYRISQEVILILQAGEGRNSKKKESEGIMSHNIQKERKSPVQKEKNPAPIRLSDRQDKILKQLRVKQVLKLADLLPLFKDVSERTLRYDLQTLLENRLIEKNGVNKGVTYFLK